MREVVSIKWIVVLRQAGRDLPHRDAVKSWAFLNAVALFDTRSDARIRCRSIRKLRWQYSPKSKGGLGYTCRPVKAEITVRWGDE